MATWRCPHCGTPQAETSRCWACSRSPLTCRTCRNFRRAIAGRLGYCALDRGRNVLTGDEVRTCWQAPPAEAEPYPGLFRDLDATPALVAPAPIIRSGGVVRAMIPIHSPVTTEVSRAQGPGPLGEALRRAAASPASAPPPASRGGRLVDAPVVVPSHRIASAAERMLRISFEPEVLDQGDDQPAG